MVSHIPTDDQAREYSVLTVVGPQTYQCVPGSTNQGKSQVPLIHLQHALSPLVSPILMLYTLLCFQSH